MYVLHVTMERVGCDGYIQMDYITTKEVKQQYIERHGMADSKSRLEGGSARGKSKLEMTRGLMEGNMYKSLCVWIDCKWPI